MGDHGRSLSSSGTCPETDVIACSAGNAHTDLEVLMPKALPWKLRRSRDIAFTCCDGEVVGGEFGLYPGMFPTDEPESVKTVSDERTNSLFMTLYFSPAPTLT